MTDNKTLNKWSTIVDRLYAHTKSEKLAWKTSVDEDTISVKVGDNHISITKSKNRNNPLENDYWVEIFSQDGRIIDRFSDEMVTGSYSKLDDLHIMAFRQANGSDAALDSILNALPDEDEIPF